MKECISPCGMNCEKCFAYKTGEIRKAALSLKENLGNFGPYAERFTTKLNPVFEIIQNLKEFRK